MVGGEQGDEPEQLDLDLGIAQGQTHEPVVPPGAVPGGWAAANLLEKRAADLLGPALERRGRVDSINHDGRHQRVLPAGPRGVTGASPQFILRWPDTRGPNLGPIRRGCVLARPKARHRAPISQKWRGGHYPGELVVLISAARGGYRNKCPGLSIVGDPVGSALRVIRTGRNTHHAVASQIRSGSGLGRSGPLRPRPFPCWPPSCSGPSRSVDADNSKFVVTGSDGKDVTVTVNASTVYENAKGKENKKFQLTRLNTGGKRQGHP